MAATTETVLCVFAHVDTTVRALEELRAKGYHDLTVSTPVPVHETEDVLERDRFGGVATLIGMVVLGRLPRLRTSASFDRRFTNDRFGVAVHCAPARSGSVREILRAAGADEVRA